MTAEEKVKATKAAYLHTSATWAEIRVNISGSFENPQYIVIGEAMTPEAAWEDAAKGSAQMGEGRDEPDTAVSQKHKQVLSRRD